MHPPLGLRVAAAGLEPAQLMIVGVHNRVWVSARLRRRMRQRGRSAIKAERARARPRAAPGAAPRVTLVGCRQGPALRGCGQVTKQPQARRPLQTFGRLYSSASAAGAASKVTGASPSQLQWLSRPTAFARPARARACTTCNAMPCEQCSLCARMRAQTALLHQVPDACAHPRTRLCAAAAALPVLTRAALARSLVAAGVRPSSLTPALGPAAGVPGVQAHGACWCWHALPRTSWGCATWPCCRAHSGLLCMGSSIQMECQFLRECNCLRLQLRWWLYLANASARLQATACACSCGAGSKSASSDTAHADVHAWGRPRVLLQRMHGWW